MSNPQLLATQAGALTHLDQVTLIDANDQVIGQMDKVEAHRGFGLLHRAISVLLFRRHGGKIELLMQQRSSHKIVGALQWANTCCGNVRPAETYQECARRRLRDELSITDVTLNEIGTMRYQVQCNAEFSENELDRIFVGWYDGQVKPNPLEVARYQWFEVAEIAELIKNQSDNLFDQPEAIAPWFVIMYQRAFLQKALATLVS